MTDNVIEFKKKEPVSFSTELFGLTVSINQDDSLEVVLEAAEGASNEEIFDAMVAVSSRFAIDSGLVDVNQTDLILDQMDEIKEQRDDIANRQDNSND